jgi:hypothetical protein
MSLLLVLGSEAARQSRLRRTSSDSNANLNGNALETFRRSRHYSLPLRVAPPPVDSESDRTPPGESDRTPPASQTGPPVDSESFPMDTNAPERTLHAPHDAAAAHMISRRSAPCFRRGESAAFDRIRTAIVRHRRDTGRDLRPRSNCTPGLSCAADARACSELGSRAKTGLGA